MMRTVFEYSRDLFRLLRPELAAGPVNPGRSSRVLVAACEESVERLAQDSRFRLHAARQLFRQVRFLFPLDRQVQVFRLIERGVGQVADRLDEERIEDGKENLLRCGAVNRKGKPCGREPMRGSRFCPSHKRYEEHAAPPGLEAVAVAA